MNTSSEKPPETAIILAAGSVPPALSAVFGRTSSAMVPINGRPTIHWILSYLHEIGIRRVVLGLRESEVRLPKFVRQTFGRIQEISYESISEDLGPGYTLLKCLQRIPEDESCLIVLGDTVFQFSQQPPICFDQSFVLTAPVQDASRWCLAAIDNNGAVEALADKPENNPDTWPALIGVYFLRSCRPAVSALQQLYTAGARSLQLRHALEPYINSRALRAYPAGEWFDCGNIDFLNSSRRRLLQARSFNTIQIDELRGVITKRSEHQSKFLNEINYYRLLPKDLATFFPRLVDFGLESKNTYLTLEYYGYPTLSEAWVFEEFEATYWSGIFKLLVQVIGCFSKYSVDLSPEATFNFYWLKTLERVASFSCQEPEFKQLVNANEVTLNGQALLGWSHIKPKIESMLRMASEHPRGQIIHGDLCFTNILCDPVSRLCKFIDPRGSFGDSGIYGDARYDVAKLLHSLDGGYDFFIHDMFVLKQDGVEFQLQQFFPNGRTAVLRGFAEVFGKDFDLKELQLLEGLLFISMCSLHKGHSRRQIAMFLTGLAILNRVLRDEDFY